MSSKIFGYEWDDIKRAQQGGSFSPKIKSRPNYKANCDSNKKFLGGEWGWFRDASSNDRVEQINPHAQYNYIYRTDQ